MFYKIPDLDYGGGQDEKIQPTYIQFIYHAIYVHKNNFKNIYFLFMCVHTCRHICVNALGGHKRVSNPLELELKVANKLPDVGDGN